VVALPKGFSATIVTNINKGMVITVAANTVRQSNPAFHVIIQFATLCGELFNDL
jgi:hypothetical protein